MDRSDNVRSIFNQYAEQYQDKYMDVGLYQDSFDRFCEQITQPQAEILEIACGPGNITRYLLQARPDFRVLGIDLAEEMLGLAERNNPGAQFRSMDAREISQFQQSFDGIICGFGLPYLSQTEAIQLIEDAGSLMRPEGVLYLSTMLGDKSQSGWQGPSDGGAARLYLHYHQQDYLLVALAANGFVLIHSDLRLNPQNADTELILIARKQT